MNICFVSSTPVPPAEGIGFYIWNLAHYLARQGHNIHIITRGGMARFSNELFGQITVWRPRYLPLYPFHVHFHRLFVDRLVRTIENEIDLFHVHSPLAPVLSTARPIMLTVHSAIRSDAEKTSIQDMGSLLLKLQAPVSVWLETQQLRQASLVNVVAPHVVDDLRTYPSCPQEVDVTWNGVDVEHFRRERYRRDSASEMTNGLSVLAVGRLVPGKGWEDFINAVSIVHKEHPHATFQIAGDGPLRSRLEKQIERNQLGHVVRMLGHVGDDEQGERTPLARLYAQADLFVMPSHYEGLPTVVLEAMASGCAVVSTRVGGVPKILDERKSGLLVEPANVQQLADAISELMSSEELREQLGRRARYVAENRFSWPVIGERYLEQYEALVAERDN